MKFSKKALIGYAKYGMDQRPDGLLLIAYFFFICLCDFFLIFNHCSVFTVIIAAISILSYILVTLILLGKHSLTNGYNFLWTSISSFILSFLLLILSSYALYSITLKVWHIAVSVISYILCAVLFYIIIIIRLSRLKEDNFEIKKVNSSLSFAGPSFVPTVLAVGSFIKSNPQYNSVLKVFLFIVLYLFSVFLILATGVIVKYIILKNFSSQVSSE